MPQFVVGEVCRGSASGKIGKVTYVNQDGNIKVWYEGDSEATPELKLASGFSKGPFILGELVKGNASGKAGKVCEVREDGNIKVHYHGDTEATPEWKLFSGFEKVTFSVGDLVRGNSSERTGRVVEVRNDGNFRIHYTGDEESTAEFKLASGFTKVPFVAGMYVRGIASGRTGKVVTVNEDGNIQIWYTGEATKTEEFKVATGFTKVQFVVGDTVRGNVSERTGKVTAVNKEGNVQVWYTGDKETTSEFKLSSGFTQIPFVVGDVIRGKASGKTGEVTDVNKDGNIKIKYTGEKEETAELKLASGFSKVMFVVGDFVRGTTSEKTGKVMDVREDGNIQVWYTGAKTADPEFKLASGFSKIRFIIGDLVRGNASGKMGTVVEVREDGNIKVHYTGEPEADPQYKLAAGFLKVTFVGGDMVRGAASGKTGKVQQVDKNGNIQVWYTGDSAVTEEFKLASGFAKIMFAVGDKVKGAASGKVAKVMAVDKNGNIQVQYDGETEVTKEFKLSTGFKAMDGGSAANAPSPSAPSAVSPSASSSREPEREADNCDGRGSGDAGRAPRTAAGGRSRWADGLDAPNAGQREFFPAGWMPDPSMTVDRSLELLGANEAMRRKILAEAKAKIPMLRLNDIVVPEADISAIMAYTAESPVYSTLTYNMRMKNTEKALAKLGTFIRQLGKALDKFTIYDGVVYRGLNILLPESSYVKGSIVCWQAFTSSTKSVMQTLNFLNIVDNQVKPKLVGTIVIIDACNGREIQLLSQFPAEEEVLFSYNTFFQVNEWITDLRAKQQALPQLDSYDISTLAVLKMTEV